MQMTKPTTSIEERIKRIREINQQKGLKNLDQSRHEALLKASADQQEVILESFRGLIDYLGKRTGKVEIVNQLENIGTPDALKVVAAIEAFHEEFNKKPDIDLSEVTNVLKMVLAQAEAIPKALPELQIPEPIDNSKQLKAIETAVSTLTKELKKKETVVNVQPTEVKAPDVHVDAPDLKPFSEVIAKSFTKAIKSLVFPEYKTDNTKVEALLRKNNKLLDEIADYTGAARTSGGGRATPYQDENLQPIFPTVVNGGIPTVDTPLAVRIDDSSTPNTTYIGKAAPGSATSAAVWQIAELDTTSGIIKKWPNGSVSFDKVWDDRTSLTYT